jgi:GTP-binding protein HflX
MGGGVGGRFGEGESQLEVDRRMVHRRIDRTKIELARVAAERAQQRRGRLASGVFKVALAGYTNAGKSTLLNTLTKGVAYADDKLFATLDSTTRKAAFPDGRRFTLSDTVGFIQKLPTTLIQAFNSTLEEITQADLVLHLVDASSSLREGQIKAVDATLAQIGAKDIPILLAFNKCDLLAAAERADLQVAYPEAVLISAESGQGMELLLRALEEEADRLSKLLTVCIPYAQGQLEHLAYEQCKVLAKTYREDGILMSLRVPLLLQDTYLPYQVGG